jgi:hypothetical protein
MGRRALVALVLAGLLAGLLSGCATKAEKAQTAAVEQKRSGGMSGSAASNAPATRDVQDVHIMDLSSIDATEEPNWMNPNNPPELKRQYQREQSTVLLPEDVYPVKANIPSSALLLKFKNADAYVYAFLPNAIASSALVDVNLNTLDLNQAPGYHDMVIELKDRTLKMSYFHDAAADGYTRYVEVKKAYQAGKMSVVALILRDPKQYPGLQGQYRSILNTIKPQP